MLKDVKYKKVLKTSNLMKGRRGKERERGKERGRKRERMGEGKYLTLSDLPLLPNN